MTDVDLELARQQWQDGNRRVEAARGDPRRYPQLVSEIERVVAGLRQRVGQTFTLDELAAHYAGADEWVHDLLEEGEPEGAVPVEPGTAADAAFHLYARGAVDYRP